jgi:quercetin dioxygenase-like cupin family protein
MHSQRVYTSSDHMQPSAGEPLRSVVAESEHAVIIAWHVEPGQTIAAHTHPCGQDTWTILSGKGLYQIDAAGQTVPVVAGDVVVARTGQVHGVQCTGDEALRFISVVAPLDAGYERLPTGA